MNKAKEILKLCAYEFRIQMLSKRVWMGYLVGIVIIMKQSFGYLRYADSMQESVNVLEAFIVAGNNYNTAMFLVLGWLLVISEAPFVNNNSLYLIYRTNKKNWNTAMLLYLFLQAAIYYGLLAGATVLLSAGNGFFANIWSEPLVELTKTGSVVTEFNVSFPYASFIKEVSVFQAFGYTGLLAFLYGLILGLLLYTFNLFSNQLVGAIAAFMFHFLGYEIMKEGFGFVIRYSLMARSVPVLQIGGNTGASLQETFIIYLVILLALCAASDKIVRCTDFREASKGEGE